MSLHSFSVDHAKKFGLTEAVLIKNFQFWIEHNIDQRYNYIDGRTWTYISMKELAKNFDYLSEKQVRTAIDRLVAAGVILKGNYNKLSFDKTLWYAFVNESEFVKSYDGMVNTFAQMGERDAQMGEAIPYTLNIYSKEDIKKENNKRKRKEFVPPTIEEVKAFFREKGYSASLAQRAFDYYELGNWHDKNNKPVLNWKLKMSNWFNDADKAIPMPEGIEFPELIPGYSKHRHEDPRTEKKIVEGQWLYRTRMF